MKDIIQNFTKWKKNFKTENQTKQRSILNGGLKILRYFASKLALFFWEDMWYLEQKWWNVNFWYFAAKGDIFYIFFNTGIYYAS